VQASRSQSRCVECGDRAIVTLHSAEAGTPGGRRWMSYCERHDPNPPGAAGDVWDHLFRT